MILFCFLINFHVDLIQHFTISSSSFTFYDYWIIIWILLTNCDIVHKQVNPPFLCRSVVALLVILEFVGASFREGHFALKFGTAQGSLVALLGMWFICVSRDLTWLVCMQGKNLPLYYFPCSPTLGLFSLNNWKS